MKVNCHMYSPNFVGEREEGKKTHGHVILLDSIKFPNNVLFKKSLRTCFHNNCVKKNLTSCLNQIKPQILTPKKTQFKPTFLHIIHKIH